LQAANEDCSRSVLVCKLQTRIAAKVFWFASCKRGLQQHGNDNDDETKDRGRK